MRATQNADLAFAQTGTAVTGTGTSATPTLTNTPGENRGLLLYCIFDTGSSAWIPPNGFSLVGSFASAGLYDLRVYVGFGTKAGGPKSFNIAWTGSVPYRIQMFELSGGVSWATWAAASVTGAGTTMNTNLAAGTSCWYPSSGHIVFPTWGTTGTLATLGSIGGTGASWTQVVSTGQITGGGTRKIAGEIYYEAINRVPAVAHNFSGTLSTSNTRGFFRIVVNPFPQTFVQGFEYGGDVVGGRTRDPGSTFAATTSGEFTTGSKNSGGTGAYGAEYDNLEGDSWNLTCYSRTFWSQVYVRPHTVAGATKYGVWGVATSMESFAAADTGVFLGVNPGTTSLFIRVGDIAGAVYTDQDASSTYSTSTWYLVQMHAYYDTDNDLVVQWWIDGVAQTQVELTTDTIDGAFCSMVGGSAAGFTTASTVKTYIDDCYIILDPDWAYTNWPLAGRSVVAFAPNADGTHVNSTHFQDAGAANPGTVYDDIDDGVQGGTADYWDQTTQDATSYLEVGFADPGVKGMATLYSRARNSGGSAGMLDAMAEIHVGGEIFTGWNMQSRLSPNTAADPTNDVTDLSGKPGVGGETGTLSQYHWWSMDAADSTGGSFTSSEMDAIKVRFGFRYNTTDGNKPRVFAMFFQVVELPIILGNDHWGWIEPSATGGGWGPMLGV